jgi:predicted ATP-grasp superfamily ATP-dependent carboligase
MPLKPVAVLYEHPAWFESLFDELERRKVPHARLFVPHHCYDPAERRIPYSVVVNRMSAYPSGGSHPTIILYVKQFLAHLQRAGANVINGYASYLVGASKAMQLDIFEQLGVAYPRARVIHHPSQAMKAAEGLAFPIVTKPNVGGSGAGILKFDHPDELAAAGRAGAIGLGIDQVALVQEFLPARDGVIARVEILDGEFLYAIRLPVTDRSFNYCPADGCQVDDPHLVVESFLPPPEIIDAVKRILAMSQADLGSVEYLVDERDGRIVYYDINPLSNFVAGAPDMLGFDPTARLVDYILKRAGL